MDGHLTLRLLVFFLVQFDTKPAKVGTYALAHNRGILADATSEHDRVNTAQKHHVGAHVMTHRCYEHIQRQLRLCIAGLGGLFGWSSP